MMIGGRSILRFVRRIKIHNYSNFSAYLNFLKERGYISYEELGNRPGDPDWVVHKNCPKPLADVPYRTRILDEEPIAMCWACGKAVDPAAMERIRSEGEPVETPGVSCWWICYL